MEQTDSGAHGLRCDIRIGWVLSALRPGWAADVRYVSTGLPADLVGRMAGKTARSLRAEQGAAEEYRRRIAFGLQN